MRTRILASLALAMCALASQAQPPRPPLPSSPEALLRGKAMIAARADLERLAALRGRLVRQAGFQDGEACVAPAALPAIDMHRSLFVHDSATLGAKDFSLQRTLGKIAADVAPTVSTSAEKIFRQFLDTQNSSANAVTNPNPHCSDSNGKVNGFPLNKCPRPEGAEAQGPDSAITARMAEYKPVALVNRIDLADKGWRNCGEHRIIYAKEGNGRNLIIFEAVLPNPKPGCRSGCRPVIDFWADLSADASPASRAGKLEKFFFTDDFPPGFKAVVRSSHYTSGSTSAYGGGGSGQIRTNQFLGGGPWTLKEFKTFLSCNGGACDFDILPTSVKVNPYGVLWNRTVATGTVPGLPPDNSFATAIPGLAAMATGFQAEVAAQVTTARLGHPDLGLVSYEVKPERNSAESQSQAPTIDHYPQQFGAGADTTFRDLIQSLAQAIPPPTLTGIQIVNRATANSCAGCHEPTAFGLHLNDSVGPGMKWPGTLGFVHVGTAPQPLPTADEFDPANFDNNSQGFMLSEALLKNFLPSRRAGLVGLGTQPICDCVPKPDLLSRLKAKIPRQRQILEQSSVHIRSELSALDQRFLARRATSADDLRRHAEEKRAVLARAEAARDKRLEAEGLPLAVAAPRPQAVRLAATVVAPARVPAAKVAKLREIVNAEPPRETIHGSFRSH